MSETTARLRKYEAMIILDSAKAGTDWEGVSGRLREMMEREGAEIESVEKWDERRLAYEIKGQRRGAYVLVHFSAPPGALVGIRRGFGLSEDVVRALVLRPMARKKKRFEVREVRRAAGGETGEKSKEAGGGGSEVSGVKPGEGE